MRHNRQAQSSITHTHRTHSLLEASQLNQASHTRREKKNGERKKNEEAPKKKSLPTDGARLIISRNLKSFEGPVLNWRGGTAHRGHY
jgi:hypothetical protein